MEKSEVKSTITSTKKNVLIYRLGSLGDTVMALPCFHKIRESFADAEIILLTNRPVMSKAAPLEAILGKKYFFDKVIDYPVGTRNLIMLASVIKKIRSNKIDTIINLTAERSKFSSFRDELFFRIAGIKHFIGFPKTKEHFTVSVDGKTGLSEWEAKRLSKRIRILGVFSLNDEHYWDLILDNQEISAAKNILESIKSDTSFFAISLGTKLQANNWGIENWIKLLKDLSQVMQGWKLIVLGSQDEEHVAQMCMEAWNNGGLNLCGKTSPRISAAILRYASMFIGHDSGPMHLAACVGTPCVGIFSARNLPGQWFPKGDNNLILYHRTDCAGCGLEVCIEQKKKCILSISVEEVKQAVFKIITLHGFTV